jgi:hypothetical protein
MSVSGGTSPYTYQWQLVSGGAGIAITAAQSQDTRFMGNVGPGNPSLTGVFRLRVTDANGIVKYGPNVNVDLEFTP